MIGKNNSTDTVDLIVRRLRTIAQKSTLLSDAAKLYEEILPLLSTADLDPAPLSMTAEQALAKMEMGTPLLWGLRLDIDAEAARELMLRLARVIGSQGENEPARRIISAIEENAVNVGDLLLHVVSGKMEILISEIKGLDIDHSLLVALAQNVLKPALRFWCRQLTPLAVEIPWHKDYCFVCGAGVNLAELQGNNLEMHMRCGQCGADWRSRRLFCTHCGNEEHLTLGCLYPDDDRGKIRVDVCDRCKRYVKVITTFSPTPAYMLPVEDLATLHLDYIAEDRGYWAKR
jgi:FdhE protein